MDHRLAFYREAVQRFIPDRNASILVVAGTQNDRDVLADLGFRDAVISNLGDATDVPPYTWDRQDAHCLSYADDSFDFAIVYAALHHCSSPHQALLEMYRVARRGVLGIEARDSLLARLLVRAGLSVEYEPAAVFFNDCKAGGVNNTEIPNFIYRWTEREIEKTIASQAPHMVHQIHYHYGWSPPCMPAVERRGDLKQVAIKLGLPFYKLLAGVMPKQRNHFAFFIPVPSVTERLQPWLRLRQGEPHFDPAWGERVFR